MDRHDANELAKRASAGDARAFEQLIAAHYDDIHAFAWRWCGNTADADDIAQTVCIKLAAAIKGFRGDAAFKTWAYRITYNAAIDHLRAGQRMRPLAPSNIVRLIDGPNKATPETELQDAQLWDQVRGLPPKQCDAVLLVYAQDLSHAAAAAVMGCTEKTVSWHLHAARKALKSLLSVAD